MSIEMAEVIVATLAAYAALGLLCGLAFVARGVTALDPQARGMAWSVRLLILPGVAALWPLMMAKWLVRSQPPES